MPTVLHRKGLFTASALLNVKNHATKVLIINANNRQFTLSKHTKLGTIAFQTESIICYTIASKPIKGNVRFRTDKFRELNDLHVHLRQQCYPTQIREHIDTMTKHIENEDLHEQLQGILWKNGRLFDTQPSVINYTLEGAINTGNHPPIHIPPYRQSGKDQQRIQDETDKLLKQDIIEPSTFPWSSPVVLVPVIPKGKIRKSIMQIYHDTRANGSHFARDRTLKTIRERYFWSGMNKGIRKYARIMS
ncbi:unnamed protein product [Didymodactylos carnosus]|uniref:Integrase zinc-binding domain-containing protein n=1 Tax=Didymodactylos carnosus TaxID=1234261 RepID=A0A815NWH4_9BILA|nr:unnamed protein product [Didymodactylos carnosus]CAF4318491.1 unnamed protein product [Didymodactylos carnosus]